MIIQRNLVLVGLAVLTVGVFVSCQSAATPTLAALSEPGMYEFSEDGSLSGTITVEP